MPYFKICPECGANDVLGNPKRDTAQCQACGYTGEVSEVRYSAASRPDVIAFCKGLSDKARWVETVFKDWPGPMAHEVRRLKELLEEGQIIGAIWQLKDLAEVLIKFPAVVMARDVLEHSNDEALKGELRRRLFGKPLSMGTWHSLAGEFLAGKLRAAGEKSLFFPQVAGVFRDRQGKPSRTARLLEDLIEWRNAEFGHGALKLDVDGFRGDLEKFVQELNHALGEQVESGIWDGVELCISGETECSILGWESIRKRHEESVPGPHLSEDLGVELHAHERILTLSPLLTVKRCTVCRKNDVFFFDSRRVASKGDHFYFLDYLAGHRMSRPGHHELSLAHYAGKIGGDTAVELGEEDVLDQGFGRRTVDGLLLEKTLEADYISPAYMRKRLRDFIKKHDRGIFWLRAPANCGKSVFVSGLVPASGLERQTLFPDIKVVAFHIKREYRFHPAQFKEYLKEAITNRDNLDISSGMRELPDLDLKSADRPGGFAMWMEELLALRPQYRLLVCLDGLDELVRTGEESLLDFLPSPDQLPERFFLLLTSRPRSECPQWMWKKVQSRLSSREGLGECEFMLEDSEYQALLKKYFFQRLRSRILEHIHSRMKNFISGKTEVRVSDDVLKGIADSSLASAVAGDWKSLIARAGVKVISAVDAPGLFKEVVQPVIEGFECHFETVLEKSERRFLYVSHITNLMRDGTIRWEDLEHLPSGDKLFQYYLDELSRILSPKQWEYAKRLILILAAAEEAFVHDLNLRKATGENFSWHGLPLQVLADLMGESSGRSMRLIFILYSLKEVLNTWKASWEPDPLYRLGLKEFSAVIRSEWRHELNGIHRNLTESFFDCWKGRFNDLDENRAGDFYGFRYLLAHADLCGNDNTREAGWSDAGLAGACMDWFHLLWSKRSLFRSAEEWVGLALLIYNHLMINLGREKWTDSVARAYTNRGIAFWKQGRLDAALRDHGDAIELRETLRATLEPKGEWTPRLVDNLAHAYKCRGIAFWRQGRLDEAICDFGVAIELMEEIRAILEPKGEWTPRLADNLASTYLNRGAAFWSQGGLDKAIDDYGIAIERREEIRAILEPNGQSPPDMVDSLAMAYVNRGAAFWRQGRLDEAICDFGVAVELREKLRAMLEPTGEWTPELADSLASTYLNRGEALQSQGQLDRAIRDNGVAIELMEQFRAILEPKGEWSPLMVDNLAIAYMNRGGTLSDCGRLDAAIRDNGIAIELMEEIRAILEPKGDWPPILVDNLARAYVNRGRAFQRQGRLDEAISDFGVAIKRREEIRAILEPNGQWPPDMVDSLATAYVNRGVAFWRQGRLDEAIRDSGVAIELMEEIRAVLEPKGEWSPDMVDNLATGLINNAELAHELGRWDEAMACFEEAIALWDKILRDGMTRFAARQMEGMRTRRKTISMLERWDLLAADVNRALTYALPSVQSVSPPTALVREWENLIGYLRSLSEKERTSLYNALGGKAAEVQTLFEG
jgi:tetratricopeptide (TPR) repeat protein